MQRIFKFAKNIEPPGQKPINTQMQDLKNLLQELEAAKINIDQDATACNYIKWSEISNRFRIALAFYKEKGQDKKTDK